MNSLTVSGHSHFKKMFCNTMLTVTTSLVVTVDGTGPNTQD